MAADSAANGQGKAEKKKAGKKQRRQKAKADRKELKAVSQKVHEELHRAQEAEAEQAAKASKKKAGQHADQVVQLEDGRGSVAIEYVPEPLAALEELKAAAEAAAVSDDPYGGVEGLAVSGSADPNAAAISELDRIAGHFLPGGEAAAEEDEKDAAEAAAEGTDAVISAGKDDPKEKEREAAEAAAAEKSNRELKREKNEQTSQLIAQLKQECPRPEAVEVWDIRARDPKLLVFLKAYRNTVPVPRHWSQKRKYLQGKRGIEKPPFQLPSYIEETGIAEMRNALQEKVQDKLKNKGKQRMRPKMGKMEIDYAMMQDAFFKKQQKPPMTKLGDLYYEGKEYEMNMSNAFPGVLSPDLKHALGMTDMAPPPWLINMQRYGPPPSYPSLKLPGLNSPLPPGAHFGYHPGGWGKPPVDAGGMPLYGDVFGVNPEPEDDLDLDEKTARWADLEEDETSEEESSEEEVEAPLTQEQLEQGIASGMMTGLASSLDGGIDTNATLELRKASGTATAGATPTLYTVLEQQAAGPTEGLTAVGHTYKVPDGQRPTAPGGRKQPEFLRSGEGGSVDVAVDPEELERLGAKGREQLYNAAAGVQGKEDYSDLVAANAAAKKRKLQEKAAAQANKKAKESFKF